MRTTAIAALTLLLAACGSGPDQAPPSAPAGEEEEAPNSPPEIVSASLRPYDATPGDMLQVVAEIIDRDRDNLDIEVEWYANGTLIETTTDLRFLPPKLQRGDVVHAVLYVSDAEDEDSWETEAIQLRNSPPRITSVRVLPDNASGGDDLMAVAEAIDSEGDQIEFRYLWTLNGQELADVAEAVLPSARIRRGDRVHVEVLPFDGNDEGSEVRSAELLVRNAAPEITSEPGYSLASPDLYAHTVTAEDPDGDTPLRFELVRGPEGMTMDIVSGELTWQVPAGTSGDFPVEVAVIDPWGGDSRQRYVLAVQWEEPPASPAADPNEGGAEAGEPEEEPQDAP
jgi:hypothetical protein